MFRSEQARELYSRGVEEEIDGASSARIASCMVGYQADAFAADEVQRVSNQDRDPRRDAGGALTSDWFSCGDARRRLKRQQQKPDDVKHARSLHILIVHSVKHLHPVFQSISELQNRKASRHIIGLLLLVLPLDLRAQDQSSAPTLNSCLAAIPQSAFKRVPIVVSVTAESPTSLPILPAADLLAQSVAERVRARFGSVDGPPPEADSVLRWDQLGGQMVVVARRDGTYSWTVERTNTLPGETRAFDILADAFAQTAASGESMFWPESSKADSMFFILNLEYPLVREDGKVVPRKLRMAFPLFSLSMPWMKEAEMKRFPRIDYPSRPPAVHVGVVVEFVVDTVGKIENGSMHEYVRHGSPALTGEEAAYYRTFRAAVLRGMSTGVYAPSLAGG